MEEFEATQLRALSPDEAMSMLDNLSDGVVILGHDWHYRYVNEPAAAMLDRTRDELLGHNIWTEFPSAVGHPIQAACEEAFRDGQPRRVTHFHEAIGRWFESRIFPGDDNLLIVFRDTTEIQQAHAEAHEYADRMKEAERIARFGVWEWDIASGRVVWSEELHTIYGLDPGDFAGTVEGFLSYLHPDDRVPVWTEIERAMQTLEPFEFEERIIRPGGEERLLLSRGRAIVGRSGQVETLVGVCHDVTERALAERALGANERRTHAIIDNLPSIVTVKDGLGRYQMVNAEFCDLLGKPAAEILGNECGQLFPEPIATRFRANDRRAVETKEVVYDEVVLTREDGRRTFSTVTFGLADEEGNPLETCTLATDVTDRHERESERRERLDWERTIASALAEERFVVFGQPVIELATDRQTSAELLVRMRSADDPETLLAPAEFLPAAERFGLVQQIDTWMVAQAVGLAHDLAVEVNLSAVTLCDPAARSEILALLEASPASAPRIVFEITETVAAEFIDEVCAFADAVTGLGCGLALDDFGTGFGSFTYLRRLPLRYLKIDRSFVGNLTASEDDQRVVKSIIGIAEQFGLHAIVEGVEDQATLEMLRDLGAHFVQGFHLGRPAALAR